MFAFVAVMSLAVKLVTDTFEPSCLKVTLPEMGELPAVWAMVNTGAATVGFLIRTRRAGRLLPVRVVVRDSRAIPMDITSLALTSLSKVTNAAEE